ncbi:MAG: DUF4350 domain-containing protein [Acidobacteriota bacterium]
MDKRILRLLTALAIIVLLIAVFSLIKLWEAEQFPDPNFDSVVANPAYQDNHPTVCIDAAHNNFHTAEGLYQPFATLISNDGYRVVSNQQAFNREALARCDLLVIANALGAWYPFIPGADRPAFSEAECDAVRDWAMSGGALLLVADHAPAGAAAERLASRFGIEMSKGYLFDTTHAERAPDAQDSWVVYSRENGLLAEHEITKGRNDNEKINRVTSFTGQSLKCKENCAAILKLTESAGDYDPQTGKEIPATNRAQAVALYYGKGRVVVLGEAAMITAQVTGDGHIKFGMQRSGNDNKQFALNIMHWLSGLLNNAPSDPRHQADHF